jgi:uncharacterized membrane protein
VIRPNRSLSWRAALRVYIVIAACCMGIATVYALNGFWPVLPFAGLEVLALGAAFYITLHRSGVQEVVHVGDELVTVDKGRDVPQEHWECPRVWAQVRLEPSPHRLHPSRLAILFQGRRVEIGGFLNEAERCALAEELAQAIRRPA